jgi:hypothetical protein
MITYKVKVRVLNDKILGIFPFVVIILLLSYITTGTRWRSD